MNTNERMVVLVTGGRAFADEAFVRTKLNEILKSYPSMRIIQGGAVGVDLFALKWASDNGVQYRSYRA